MDSTLPSCRLLLPPSIQQRPNGRKNPGDHGGLGRGRPVRVRAWRKSAETSGGDGDRRRGNTLFGGGFRAVKRVAKLKSAIQNRSVRELLELIYDECRYIFGNLPSVDVSKLARIKKSLDALILTVANKVLPEGMLDEDSSAIIAWIIIGLVVMVLFYAMYKNL